MDSITECKQRVFGEADVGTCPAKMRDDVCVDGEDWHFPPDDEDRSKVHLMLDCIMRRVKGAAFQ